MTESKLRPAVLHDLFRARAAAQPDAVALVWGDTVLTYSELDLRTDRLAWRLRDLGVVPETTVAVLMDRRPGLLVALLAVLKAGGAYLPLDPEYPRDRLAFMLADSGAQLVVSRTPVADALPEGAPALVLLDREDRTGAGRSGRDEVPWAKAGARNLAYLIYTSGSTGRPKGVAIEHRSAVALVDWAREVFPAAALRGVLASTSICFDLSVFEIFVPLAAGGRVILVGNALDLASLHGDRGVTLVNTVPSVMSELLRLGALPPGARTVHLAGEPLPRALADELYRREAVRDVYNLYGPSEDTTYSTFARVPESDPRPPTIGRPVRGSRAWLLDRLLEPVPAGADGELFLGGAGLARGYARRPALTAERFLPDPFTETPGSRLYRTGDLGRARPDGEIEFLGRFDHQIKLRGHRIELGEIEAALAAHEAIADAVVTAHGGPSDGPPSLVAFVVPEPGSAGLPAPRPSVRREIPALRRHLSRRLPKFMVPAAFAVLETLPRTLSGKIDRSALAARELREEDDGRGGERFGTPLEEVLAAIWAGVLGRERIGPEERLFDVGGHSLNATRVVSRVREALGTELTIPQVMEAPTVAALARVVEARERRREDLPEVPELVPRKLGEAPLPASFAQRRLWFLDRWLPGNVAYNLPLALFFEGPLEVPVLGRALGEIGRRHEALRTTFEDSEAGPRQVVAPPRDATADVLPVVDHSGLAARGAPAAEALARREARRPFDLARGPLWRFFLVRAGDREHLLFSSFHHIVFDGWSMDVFFRELETLVGLSKGEAPRLPPLPIQYPDFALWQHGWLEGKALERELAGWRERLAGAPPVLELPTDRRRPAAPSFRGAVRRFELTPETRARMEALGSRRGATLFMVAMATYQTFLALLAGRRDLVVGAVVANRTRRETEGLIGFFANTLALRAELPGDPPFLEVLDGTRRETLAAFTRQELPFEKLVEALAPARDASTAPLVQVVLVLQSLPPELVPIPGLRGRHRMLPVGAARFDFGMELAATACRGLAGTVEYASDLFDATTVRRWVDGFRHLLLQALGAPEARLSELSLLSAAERHEVLAEWQGGVAPPGAQAVHRQFERRADETPHAVAVAFEEAWVTYGELERRANQLSRHLKALARPRDDLGWPSTVGVLMERSVERVVGLLAVLKAGRAFLPLDPSYPEERLRCMLEDSGASTLLVSERPSVGLGPDRPVPRIVDLGADREEIARRSAGRPDVATAAGQPAYVIYTSGSTGRPKGVVVPHRALDHVLQARAREVTALDVKLQKTPLSFDVAIAETFLPLVTGGRTELARPGGQLDDTYLGRMLRERRVTLAVFSPAQLASLLEEGAFAGAGALRTVGVGGEAVPPDLPGRFFAQSGAGLSNRYGPSEATIFMLEWRCRRGEEPGVLPVGRPIHGVRAALLGPGPRPVPIGAPGEIHVGGPVLALGYLARPASTAAAFVPDPRGPRPGERLYRTGDLARHRADGAIEFLGRRDHQVKVRGFRIETGEVEAALARHPAVREAAVLARSDLPGGAALVAWLATAGGLPPPAEELRGFLRERLPPHMVPAFFVPRESLPRGAAGKVDREALRQEPLRAPEPERGAVPRGRIERAVADLYREVLGVESPRPDVSFFDLGGHSLLLPRLRRRLRETFGRDVSIVDLFRRPTVASLAELLDDGPEAKPAARDGRPPVAAGEPVAILGMSGRFPGAASVEELWRNLRAGVESISFFSEEELAESGVDPELSGRPDYVPARGVLEDADLFDAAFFGYSPREAELLDPQQRLFLECAHQALEDAGYGAAREAGRVGVFAGTGANTYERHALASRPDLVASAGRFQLHLSGDKDFLTTRVSYKLDLTGPSVDVQTACSTSLVAVHLACASLRRNECDVALAGAASVQVPQRSGHLYEQGMIFSPDGRCRAFDARAQGVVGGNGVGVVVLKPLARAREDGDRILAVVLGSAINNDGALKAGYTAPSVEGQAAVVAAALADAGVEAETLGYVEAHGTGTPLGDPIEVAALERAFDTERKGFCALGSVKTNLGHLDTAAGMAGLVKAVLALEHREIPPSLHFEKPNPQIDFAAGPFFVNDRLRPWEGEVRRAGVSSFGIGGTNAHVVLEEAPPPAPSDAGRPWQLLPLSARTPAALERLTGELAGRLGQGRAEPLPDVAFTLAAGRRPFEERRVVVGRTPSEAAELLARRVRRRVHTGSAPAARPEVVFLLPGQGAQAAGMGRELYRSEETFREHLDRCAALLEPHLGLDLRHVLDPPAGGEEEAARTLGETWLTQPALFAFEYSLARQWAAWGVDASALLGHSLGELVAACLAGVMELPEALALVAARGRLLETLPPGAMVSVPLPEDEVVPRLTGGLALAAANGPRLSTVAGPPAEVAALVERWAGEGVATRPLSTSRAFHSPMVEPVLGAYRREVERVELRPPRRPFLSGVTGTWIEPAAATDPAYWARQLRAPVRFGAALEEVCREPGRVLLEVGPGRELSSLAGRRRGVAAVVASLGTVRGSEQGSLLAALGRLWTAGVEVDWQKLYDGQRRRRVSLPTYPFERRRCWIEPAGAGSAGVSPAPRPAGTSSRRQELCSWFYAPCWKPAPPAFDSGGEGAAAGWLIFADDGGLAELLAERLRDRAAWIATVRPAGAFHAAGDDYGVEPATPEHYVALFRELGRRNPPLERIVHLWNADPSPAGGGLAAAPAQDRAFYSLMGLARALGEHPPRGALRLDVISTGLQALHGAGPRAPEKATLLGACRVLPAELPGLTCRSIDLPEPGVAGLRDGRLLDLLTGDLLASGAAPAAVAYSGYQRWIEDFEPVALPPAGAGPPRLRRRGVYLVTGGLGGIGLTLARHLAESLEARLVLVGRTALPPRHEWPERLAAEGAETGTAGKLRRVLELESVGAEVHLESADVADAASLTAALDRARARFGPLHGVIHAAGVPGGGMAALRTRDQAAAVLAPKVDGTVNLARVLAGEELDFVLLCSSLTSVLGGAGQIDYCAANLFLDAFAQAESQRGATPWIAVRWDGWSEVGMLAAATRPGGTAAGRPAVDGWQITPEEGVEVFRRAVASALPNLLVSTLPLGSRLTEARGAPEARAGAPEPAPTPVGEVEETLAAVWEELLGIERVGVDDDFFELGGHSLLATQVLSRIRDAFGVPLTLRQLLDLPTIAELGAEIRAAARGDSGPRLAAAGAGGDPPLSFAQERLWFLDRWQAGNVAYNLPVVLRFDGLLDVAALASSLGEIERRHQVLRAFFAGDDLPVQKVAPFLPAPLELADLSALAGPDGAREAELRLAAEARRPFDLARGPLWRRWLMRLGKRRHELFLCFHHAVFDGWSMEILLREVEALYTACAAGRPAPLPEIQVSYADFASWQRRRLAGEALEREVDWWRERLRGAPQVLELPADRPRPSVRSDRGAEEPVALSGGIVAGLRRLALAEGATLFMGLLAGFGTLLARLAGRREVIVGVPVANRNHTEIEGLIGFFVNTLALRLDAAGRPHVPFATFLGQVRQAALEAFEHQDLPFEKLVEELRPERHLSHTPLVQVVLVVQKALGPMELPGGLRLTPRAFSNRTSKFDLTLLLEEGGADLCGIAEYSTDLFDRATVRRFFEALETLLAAAAAAPGTPLSDLPLLPEAACRQVLEAWRGPGDRYPVDACLHELVERRVDERPEAVAVVMEGRTVSYGELDRRSNRLARRLRRLGAGPEARVGLYLERSIDLVAGFLGALKAGGAYVPLDPAHPPARTRFVLADAGVEVLVTQRSLGADLDGWDGPRLEVDAEVAESAGDVAQDDARIPAAATPGTLAYVIYTSGSTGRPKGVLVTQANAVRLFAATAGFGFGRDDVWTFFHSAAFDFSVWEVWGALVHGGRLVVVPYWVSRHPEAFAELLERERVTVLNQTPSALRQLTAAAERRGENAALRWVVLGGEAVEPGALEPWLGGAGPRLVNMYGITETTVHVTFRPLAAEDLATPWLSPIGAAIGDLELYVFDRLARGSVGEVLPAGVPGELHVGGAGVARGYLGRAALTAERFVPDPYGAGPGGRLYRTGDLVRWRPAGELEYLGRIDQQVKLRGFRIELGEIESVLAEHPGVASATVVLRRDLGADEGLGAYLTAGEPPSGVPGSGALREFLRRRLPEYMVPAFFEVLEAMPLTPSGKVDRDLLTRRPPPRQGAAETDGSRTPAEELLAGLCAEVLGLEGVALRDNFFELGGHSLLAVRLVSRIRRVFGLELGVREVFEAADVAALARRVERARRRGDPSAPAAIQPVPRESSRAGVPASFAASFAQERLWFLDQWHPGGWEYNIPLAYRLAGPLDLRALSRALGGIERRHEVLRTTFAAAGGAPRQVTAPWRPAPLPVVDLAGLDPGRRDVACRLEGEGRRAFDLARGPLWRRFLVEAGGGDRFLFLCFHHIAFDGVSLEIFLRELDVLYRAFAAGRSSPLPALEVQYADFSVWHRRWLDGEVLEREVGWWRRRLDGAPELAALPADRPRPPVRSSRGAAREVRLPEPLARALSARAKEARVTLFMALLAAYAGLAGRLTGQSEAVVGSPVANRTRRETEGLIGFFVNLLALRIDLAGDPEFAVLLERVRSVALDAYAHQELPFEKLVEELRPERHPDRTPFFQVSFVLQGRTLEPAPLGDLLLEPVFLEVDTAKFDLTLGLEKTSEGLAGLIEYSTELFDAATVRRLGEQLERLLSAAVADPGRRLSELPLLSAAQRHQLSHEWAGDPRGDLREALIHDFVAARARRAPESVAMSVAEGAVSYGELGERAHRLAAALRRLGVGADLTVGLAAEPGFAVVVGFLGILEAGGACLPLDLGHPAGRLSFQVDDARASVVLVHGEAGREIVAAACPAARIVRLDAGGECAEAEGLHGSVAPPRAAADNNLAADNLAYVIYTSGTTGRPKGVGVSHRQVLPVLRWSLEYFQLGPGTRVLQNLSHGFDFGFFELVTTLMAGGRLVFLEGEARGDAARFAAAVERHGADTLHSTPAFVREVVAAGRRLRTLRVLHLGGEALGRDLVRRIADATAPGCRILNGYGPTEVSINATIFAVAGRGGRRAAVPIGRATADTTAYVVDRRLEAVPVGVAGELALGGAGVARGYLRRPEPTAERFVPDPFGRDPGRRLYRSGDLARFLPTGVIDFLGRIDHQVKVRGFRVEPGEVEAALRGHPAVAAAVVTARREGPAGTGLVAYLVPRPETPDAGAPTPGRLRDFLKRELPEPMVPAFYLWLDELPLTSNGKIDRDALDRMPLPSREEGAAAGASSELRTPTEEILAGIWSEVLGRERIHPRESFFDLGGHSLLAVRVTARVAGAFGTACGPRVLFDHPTVAAMATEIDRRRAVDQTPGAPPDPVRARPRGGPLPLSFAQERLWFLDQWQPGDASYLIPVRLDLRGDLRTRALARALDEITRRHEALRTTLHAAEAAPVQVIHPWRPRPLPLVDLSLLGGGRSAGAAEAHTAAEARRVFDLARGPLWRALLLRLGRNDHALVLTFHHIVFDGWSTGVFFRELEALYRTSAAGRPSPLPEPALQYADFAAWQRDRLAGELVERETDFWRRRLAGAPALLELPADRPRPAVRGTAGSWLPVRLPETLRRTLAARAREQRVTLFMALLAAFDLLLARLSGQHDVVVGTPVANRTHQASEGLIGFFVNTLVLRVDLREPADFAALLERVREVALSAYAHQQLPFEKLVEELRPERDMGHTPFFQVSFVLQNAPAAPPAFDGLEVELSESATGTAKFDLTLVLEETGDGLNGLVEHRRDLFDAATVQRWIGHFEVLLSAAAADPGRRLADLPFLSPSQRQQLLWEWSAGSSRPAGDGLAHWEGPVHRLFELQAAARPEAVAVELDERHLSYRELDRRAGRLAYRLACRGIGPEVRVGLYLERCPELVTALLAVLRAGGTYVPLDPSHPEQRRRFILRDAGVALLLTTERLEMPADVPRIDLEAGPAGVDGAGTPGPARRTAPEQLAYALYTSGSTGRPKGVMVPHRALSNLLRWMLGAFSLGPGDRYLQRTPIGFDASVWEIFAPLASGGRLVLARPGAGGDPGYLARAVAERAVTTLQLVPALLALYVEEPGLAAGSLRRLGVGGEALPVRLAERLGAVSRPGSPLELINLYGPTEACVQVVAERCAAAAGDWPEVPIGRPIPGVRVPVTDPRLRLLPAGAVGELLVGGSSLARGYLGDPRRTAESFVPDPYGGFSGERLYRTGDLVRSLPDGRLLFLRRRDHQLKLRGLRIELGEIEAALAAHPAIREAVAAARAGAGGEAVAADRVLVAWLAGPAPPESRPTAHELRRFLGRTLPDYMVPARFAWLDSLPVTPSGKIDRAALDDREMPEMPGASDGTAPDRPPTPTEEILAGIWSEVLKRDRVELDGNFFDLGGHSLIATRITSRASALFGVPVGPRVLFERPTLAEMAADAGAVEPIRPVARNGPLPMSFAQTRLWFLDQLSPGDRTYNSLLPLSLEGRLDVRALRRAFTEIVRRHEVLRTTFTTAGERPVQRIAPPGEQPMPLVDLGGLGEAARRAELQRVFLEHGRPFDLARGPLFRTSLARLADDAHALVVAYSHIVFDGWSAPILVREAAALYEAYSRAPQGADVPSPLPPLPVQYADFAVWQQRLLGGEALEEQLAYWRRALSTDERGARIPHDVPRSRAGASRSARLSFRTSPAVREALRRLGREEGATLFMVLCAAFQTVLHRSTGAGSVSVSTPIANRHHLEIEELIGFFVNILVIRADFTGRPAFREVLRRVREAALGAYARQDLPFEMLVETLQQPGRPLFQAVFTLVEPAPETRRLPGLTLGLFPTDTPPRGAAFELSLAMGEIGEELGGTLEYDRSLFEDATAEALLTRFRRLLDAVAAEPDRRLDELEIMSADEERRLHAAAAAQEDAATGPAPGRGKDFRGRPEVAENPQAAEKQAEERLRSMVSSRRKGLSEAKKALLARRLRGQKNKEVHGERGSG